MAKRMTIKESFDRYFEKYPFMRKIYPYIMVVGLFSFVIIPFIPEVEPPPLTEQELVEQAEKAAEAQATMDEVEAYSCSQIKVKDLLNYPNTADFPWLSYNVYLQGEEFLVSSTVTAQNAFGVEQTLNWQCIITDEDVCAGECSLFE